VYRVVQSNIFSPPNRFKDEHDNTATCEVWSVIRFLNAKNVHPVEIHKHILKYMVKV